MPAAAEIHVPINDDGLEACESAQGIELVSFGYRHLGRAPLHCICTGIEASTSHVVGSANRAS